MAVTQKINIQLGSATSDRIDRGMFETNALSDVNTDADGNPTQGFIQAVRDLNVTDLRFPGGTIEGANDILAETVGNRLSPQATNFLNWVRGENANGLDLTVTLAIPSKRPITYDEVYNFARIVARDYPDLVKAVEIGNEYSIGETTINETIYGQRADIAARALADGFAAQGLIGDAQPDIVLQMAEIFGHGSSFSGTGDHLSANQELIAQLSTPAIKAIDGVVNHYYYIEEHQFDENFADPNNQGEINRETRFLFKKLEAFEDAWSDVAGSKQLDFYMTEWNVNRLNYDQHGLKAASALLQQFSYMVEMGVETAHIWPIQHKTGSAFAGSALGPSNPGPGATLFSLMSDSLSHDGAYNMKLMDLTGTSVPRGVSIEAFQNHEKTVLYVSSRADDDQNIRLDLRSIASQIKGYSAVIVGYDKASSDGLSEMADPNGSNRTIKREISAFEYEKLKKLPFFDINNPDHISISEAANGTLRYKTYLPTAEDIIPLVDQPKTIEDYYFASESDTLGELEYLSQQQLGGKEAVSFTLNPYEVIEITVTHGQEIVAPQPTTLTHVTGTTSVAVIRS